MRVWTYFYSACKYCSYLVRMTDLNTEYDWEWIRSQGISQCTKGSCHSTQEYISKYWSEGILFMIQSLIPHNPNKPCYYFWFDILLLDKNDRCINPNYFDSKSDFEFITQEMVENVQGIFFQLICHHKFLFLKLLSACLIIWNLHFCLWFF